MSSFHCPHHPLLHHLVVPSVCEPPAQDSQSCLWTKHMDKEEVRLEEGEKVVQTKLSG